MDTLFINTVEAYAKAEEIINEAKTNENFHQKYANNTIGTGERASELIIYLFELTDDLRLVIDFTEFSFDSYSVISKDHLALINELDGNN